LFSNEGTRSTVAAIYNNFSTIREDCDAENYGNFGNSQVKITELYYTRWMMVLSEQTDESSSLITEAVSWKSLKTSIFMLLKDEFLCP